MGNYIIFILLLGIFHSILFFNKALGLNVILFVVPIVIFLTYVLKNSDKIKNKWGLLFIIPIVLLASTFFIYDNELMMFFNIIAIPTLIIMMYIFTIRPTFNIFNVLSDGIYLIFEPLNCISKFYNVVKAKLDSVLKLSDKNKKILKSFLVVVPVVVVVLILLTSADMIFNSIFKDFFKIFEDLNIENILGRLVRIAIIFTYIGASLNYVLFHYKNKKNKDIKVVVDDYTIKILLTVLNVIYVVFDFIQIKSLILHKVASNINYAQYARTGFFQLMFISVINLVIILLSKHSKKEDKYSKSMGLVMILLTTIIIVSSALRMHLYESAYGYTYLRLLVYLALLTESILLIPTVFYIVKNKFNILKYYLIITVSVYTAFSLLPLDYIIANNNINRYYSTNKIDIDYLENYNSDNVPLLIELYNRTDDNDLKGTIEDYFEGNDFYRTKDFQEYNISKNKANNLIKDFVNNKK